MQEIAGIESEAYLALVRALRNTKISATSGADRGRDFTLAWNGRSYQVDIKSAGHGWPSDVRRVLSQYGRDTRRNIIFYAPRFSDAARQALAEHSSNWLDASSLHLHLPGKMLIHIERSDDPASPPRKFAWSRSAFEIAEYVLANEPKRLKLARIAQATGWSRPMVSKTLIQWDLLGWTAKRGSPRGANAWRELASPGGLLEAWSAERAMPEKRGPQVFGHAITRDPVSFAFGPLAAALRKLDEHAFTSWIAASRIAPYTTTIPSIHVYVPNTAIDSGSYEDVFSAAGLKQVADAAVVTLEGAGPDVFRNAVSQPLRSASMPRVYADLLQSGGRGGDVAEHLREVAIGY